MRKICVLFLTVFCLSVVKAYSLTLLQIRTEIRQNIKDANASRQRYTDAVVNDYINDVQRDIVNATWLIENTTTYDLIPMTTYYALPSDLIAIKKVEFGQRFRSTIFLDETTIFEISKSNQDWKRQVGTPVQYYVETSSTSTSALISYNPIPANGVSTGTVNIRYYAQALDMSNDSDVPFSGHLVFVPYHIALVYGATMKIKLIEGETDEATAYGTFFNGYVDLIKNKIGQKPNYNPGTTTRPMP